MRQIAELSTSMRRRAIHSGYQNDHVAPQTCLTDEIDTAEIDDDKSNDDEIATGWARV
jgi:hypothetical protein